MKVKVICSICKKKKYVDVDSLKEAHKFKKMYNDCIFKCTVCSKSPAQMEIGIFQPKRERKSMRSYTIGTDPYFGVTPKSLAQQIYGECTEETVDMVNASMEIFKSQFSNINEHLNEKFGRPRPFTGGRKR